MQISSDKINAAKAAFKSMQAEETIWDRMGTEEFDRDDGCSKFGAEKIRLNSDSGFFI